MMKMFTGENYELSSHEAVRALEIAMDRWQNEYAIGNSSEEEKVAAVYADDEEYALKTYEVLQIVTDFENSDSETHLVKSFYIATLILELSPRRPSFHSGVDLSQLEQLTEQTSETVQRKYRLKHYLDDTWLIMPAC